MDIEELQKILPHRAPMLLLDEASLLEDGTGSAVYTVRGDEWFLQGHFPGMPIVPGVIQCEMMAQASCVLMQERLAGNVPLFAAIDNVKFKGMVLPGDVIDIKCTLTRERHPFYFVKGEAFVKGKLCSSGDFSFMITEIVSK